MTLFLFCISALLLSGLLIFFISQYQRINFPLWFILTGYAVLVVLLYVSSKPDFHLFFGSGTGFYASVLLLVFSMVSIFVFRLVFERRGFGKGKDLLRRLPVKGDTDQNSPCLITFDDGPSGLWTPEILQTLKENGVYAIFFLVGTHSEENPDVVKQIEDAGCEAAVHSYSHKPLPFLFSGKLKEEMEKNYRAVEKITGKRPRFFRPPWGMYNREVLDMAESLGLRTILWSRSSIDWKEKDPDRIIKNSLHDIKPGEIFLFHDGCKKGASRQATARALPAVLKKLKDMGFIFNSFYDIKN
jgi:peptidoglycan/xylan/chitin deacetylase (PgdA/CDA1 family)